VQASVLNQSTMARSLSMACLEDDLMGEEANFLCMSGRDFGMQRCYSPSMCVCVYLGVFGCIWVHVVDIYGHLLLIQSTHRIVSACVQVYTNVCNCQLHLVLLVVIVVAEDCDGDGFFDCMQGDPVSVHTR